MFSAGEMVVVDIGLGVYHYGIATECGTIISASRRTGCVAEESECIFSNGKRIISKGYPSDLPPNVVVDLARQSIGKRWSLLDYNCEHFATECHGQKQSSQLQQVLLVLGCGACAFLFLRGKAT